MTWLIAAYGVIWIAIFMYVFGLDRKQKALTAELQQLRSKLDNP
jgi:CcmD family protein